MGQRKTEEQAEMFEGPANPIAHNARIVGHLSLFADELQVDREALRKCLIDQNVQHVGEKGGRAVYSLRDVYNALTSVPDDDASDPDKLSEATLRRAFKRKAWWEGERQKLHLQRERRALVDALDVEQAMGKLAQIFVRGIETLEDVLERDAGLTPQQAERMQRHGDQVREDIYKHVARGLAADPDEPQPAVAAAPSAPEPEKPNRSRAAPTSSGSALDDGVAFLRRELAGGPRRTADLIAAARAIAISEGTLRRAKADLGREIKAKRDGKAWAWQLARD
jgi:hypothetical protein